MPIGFGLAAVDSLPVWGTTLKNAKRIYRPCIMSDILV